jgi:hypothetical protein
MAPSITPSHRNAPVVTMLDLVVTSSDTGTFARDMDELQEFVYEVYKTS